MNRTDRLLAIVLELQARGRARAQDLANHFETSKRTIYRDIEALCEAGVPIVAIPGQGYSLAEGYFLPPLSFSAAEATTLLLGSDFIAQTFDPQYRLAALAAARKIEAVLPERRRAELRDLRDSLHVIVPAAPGNPAVAALLGQFRQAISERRTVEFRYHARSHQEAGDEASIHRRQADPYDLVHVGGAWNLVAYCHLRQDIRNFRLDRIEELRPTGATFAHPAGFEQRIGGRADDRPIIARVLFDHTIARGVRESRFFFKDTEEEHPDGLLVTLHLRHEHDAVPWLLGWGRHARVLEPASLRQLLVEEAATILQNAQAPIALLT